MLVLRVPWFLCLFFCFLVFFVFARLSGIYNSSGVIVVSISFFNTTSIPDDDSLSLTAWSPCSAVSCSRLSCSGGGMSGLLELSFVMLGGFKNIPFLNFSRYSLNFG